MRGRETKELLRRENSAQQEEGDQVVEDETAISPKVSPDSEGGGWYTRNARDVPAGFAMDTFETVDESRFRILVIFSQEGKDSEVVVVACLVSPGILVERW